MARKPAAANLDATGQPIGGPPPQPQQAPVPQIGPDQTPSPTDPTMFPDEPITEGLALGPGRGPEALASRLPAPNPTVEFLRAVLSRTGDPDVRRLLARANQKWMGQE